MIPGPLTSVPTIYIPLSQADDKSLPLVFTWFSPSWVVRARGAQSAVIEGVQRAVASVDPQLPLAGFRSMDQVRRGAVASQRFLATLLSLFAGLALVLAAVGIYGLIAHLVNERTREMGIRMALGSTITAAMAQVAAPGLRLAAYGATLGCLLAAWAARLLEHFLWGVGSRDWVTFLTAAGGLILVAAAASILPALRLARLDPAQTLRHE